MKRTILRSVILTLSLILAIIIADFLPGYLGKSIGTSTTARIVIGLGVLLIIFLLIIGSTWVSQKIKRGRGNNRSTDK
jgi:uncharacterized membrane protein (DUF485 family)